MEEKDIILEIAGMGFIVYADFAVQKIKKGEDFLSEHYQRPEDVAKEVNAGRILGVCTGSPGTYILKVREGVPCDELSDNTKLKRRLSIKVKGGCIHFRDLYDLMDWDETCDEKQNVKMDDGFYTILLAGNIPNSGWRGDNQVIYMHFIKDREFSETEYKGVPNFIQAGKRAILPPLQNRKKGKEKFEG